MISTPPRPQRSQSSHQFIAPERCIPRRFQDLTFSVINSADMAPFFRAARIAMLNRYLPGREVAPVDIITEVDFVTTCRWLTKARCDAIFHKETGDRRAGRIAIPPEFNVPKCISDTINSIGVIHVDSGAVIMVPEPEANPLEVGDYLSTVCTSNMRRSFIRFTNLMTEQGIISTGRISMAVDGTCWWMLSPITPAAAVAAGNADVVRVLSFFREFTPADSTLAAIVQRNFNGQTEDDPTLNWTTDFIRGITSMRAAFCCDAYHAESVSNIN